MMSPTVTLDLVATILQNLGDCSCVLTVTELILKAYYNYIANKL